MSGDLPVSKNGLKIDFDENGTTDTVALTVAKKDDSTLSVTGSIILDHPDNANFTNNTITFTKDVKLEYMPLDWHLSDLKFENEKFKLLGRSEPSDAPATDFSRDLQADELLPDKIYDVSYSSKSATINGVASSKTVSTKVVYLEEGRIELHRTGSTSGTGNFPAATSTSATSVSGTSAPVATDAQARMAAQAAESRARMAAQAAEAKARMDTQAAATKARMAAQAETTKTRMDTQAAEAQARMTAKYVAFDTAHGTTFAAEAEKPLSEQGVAITDADFISAFTTLVQTEAAKNGLSGSVAFAVLVDKSGKVASIQTKYFIRGATSDEMRSAFTTMVKDLLWESKFTDGSNKPSLQHFAMTF